MPLQSNQLKFPALAKGCSPYVPVKSIITGTEDKSIMTGAEDAGIRCFALTEHGIGPDISMIDGPDISTIGGPEEDEPEK